MAAETLALAGVQVEVFDAMPSVGRKFLLAGRGGLNITHSEAFEAFAGRYGSAGPDRTDAPAFGPQALRDWVEALGVSTFVGTSGRVFPDEMKAAPAARAGCNACAKPACASTCATAGPAGPPTAACALPPRRPARMRADATLLALGGGSWARLGSDGAWVPLLAAAASPWRRCARPTAALVASPRAGRAAGASTCAAASPASPSSRWRCASTATRRRAPAKP
jgi:predicted flavoprotein YhiN